MSAPTSTSPSPRLPLAGFLPVFWWGLTRVLRRKKILLVALAVVGFGFLIGRNLGDHRTLDHLALVLDRAVLRFGLPLVALLLVAEGFTVEVQSRTLVYHLIRPVSRITVFLARFFSGVVPAAAVSLLLLATLVVSSGAHLDVRTWASLPATALMASLALGAVYYALAAILRHGLVAGLIYTFVVETLISSVPGSMQRLSVMFHVRSLHHALTAGALPVVPPEIEDTPLLQGASRIAEGGAWDSVLVLLAVTAAALAVGAWRVARRDWALKD